MDGKNSGCKLFQEVRQSLHTESRSNEGKIWFKIQKNFCRLLWTIEGLPVWLSEERRVIWDKFVRRPDVSSIIEDYDFSVDETNDFWRFNIIGRKTKKMLRELKSRVKGLLVEEGSLRFASGRCWNVKLNKILLKFGAKALTADPCV